MEYTEIVKKEVVKVAVTKWISSAGMPWGSRYAPVATGSPIIYLKEVQPKIHF